MIGDINSNTPVSSYQPSLAVTKLTNSVRKDYERGQAILDRGWEELNGRSIYEDMNHGSRMANAFVDEEREDPATAWEYRGTRSKARNKGLAMHAQLTAVFLIPAFTAQNDDSEIDRNFSDTMREIVEWMTLPQNSSYQSSFLALVTGMLESPVVYLGAEYCEVFQKIKEKTQDGKYVVSKILDEVLSGFNAPIYGATEVLISNAHERNIQKQKCVIKRKWIEYSEAEAKYGDHDHWMYVQAGVRSVYNESDGLFYDVKDDEHMELVSVETYMNRRDDIEIDFVGGIYMGAPNVDDNPIRHRDNRNTPKYNIVPFVYNRIGLHFFFGKSMMNAVGWDNQLYDAMSEMIMNGAFIELQPPVAVTGTDKIDTDINFPGAVTTFANENAKAQAIFPPKNFATGFNALTAIDDSIQEATLSDTTTGQLPPASQKAFTVAQAQANAKKLIAGTAQALAQSITEYGPLMADIVLNHYTTPIMDEITGNSGKLKYRKFMLEKQMVDGKEVDKEIRFDESLIGKYSTKEDADRLSLKLLEESGYPDTKKSLRVINPHLFSKYKYLSRIDPEEMFPKNSDTMSALLTSLYQLVANNPYWDMEALSRELAYSYFKGRGDKFIVKQPAQNPAISPVPSGGLPAQIQQKQNADILNRISVV